MIVRVKWSCYSFSTISLEKGLTNIELTLPEDLTNDKGVSIPLKSIVKTKLEEMYDLTNVNIVSVVSIETVFAKDTDIITQYLTGLPSKKPLGPKDGTIWHGEFANFIFNNF